MTLIKGVTVTLQTFEERGVDEFNAPLFDVVEVNVDNVLIEPASNEAIVSEYDLYGKRLAYVLHIPKGDTHDWKNAKVVLPPPWNMTLQTYGDCLIYDPQNTPLDWNKKVKAELYG